MQGAVENLLERSLYTQLADGSIVKLDQKSKNQILESLHEMSSSALRCLGFAYKEDLQDFETYDGDEDHPAHQLLLNPSTYPSIESGLVFVGLVGIRVSFFTLALHITFFFPFSFIIFTLQCVFVSLLCVNLIGPSKERGSSSN